MNFSEKMGKNVEEAVALALEDLKVTIDQVNVEVIEEPSKGFLGIGSKFARVKVTIRDGSEDLEKATNFIKELVSKMNLDVTVTSEEKEEVVYINVEGKDTGTVIGKRGQTLDSIQYLANLAVNRGRTKYSRIVINAEGYREKREKTLVQLAERLGQKVIKSGKSVRLEPMNPYERKVIHATLQQYENLVTKSEGEEPYRRIIIGLQK